MRIVFREKNEGSGEGEKKLHYEIEKHFRDKGGEN
jgi:hypothetical protein